MQMQANQRQAVLDDRMLAILAGFFAGEGSISTDQTTTYNIYASLGNSEKMWIDLFYSYFGGSSYIENPKYTGAKYIFRWRVSGNKAATFLRAIRPFLIGEKAQQADLMLEQQKLKEQHRIKTGGKNRRFPSEILLQLKSFHQKMKHLRRAAAETNRIDATPERSDSPIPQEIVENSEHK